MTPYTKNLVIPLNLMAAFSLGGLLVGFSWWIVLWTLVVWFIIGGIGVEIALHRLYAHRSFEIKSGPMRWTLGLLACLGAQWSPIWWAALHRGYHHSHTDKPRDIHSPIHGAWQSFMGWQFDLKPNDVKLTHARHLLKDDIQVYLHQNYKRVFWTLMFFIMSIGYLFWSAWPTCVTLGVFLAMHQENVINLVCHSWGYRNFDTDDRSTNVWPLGILVFGQGFHNNHHAKPSKYDFGHRWYEIDVCRWIVPALIWLDRKLTI